MPLTRIRQTAIGNDSITTAKLDDTSGGLTLPGVEYVKVPVGTTAQRPSSPANGYMRYNTDFERLEQYADGQWQSIDTPPSITSLSYSGSLTAADPAGGETITLAGSNFQAGATVRVDGTSATSVSVVSSTSITFTTPAKTAGDYDVVVTNSNGLSASLTNGISYNGTPAFTTAAGNVGSIAEDVAMSTITIVAAEPDGGTLAYSITSGALPTGTSLGSANGEITGTPNVNVTSDTTYNFTVTATDDENQTNSRAFNLIVLRPVYTRNIEWSYQSYVAQNNWAYAYPYNIEASWTLAFWFRTNGVSGYSDSIVNYLVSWGPGSGGSGAGLFWSNPSDSANNTNEGSFQFFGGSTATRSTATTRNPARDGTKWHHVCLQNNAGTLTMYLDGVQDTGLTFTNATANNGGAQSNVYWELGTWHDGGGYQGDTRMAEVVFINGSVKPPTDFGESVGGVWKPKDLSNYSWPQAGSSDDIYLNFENWSGQTIPNEATGSTQDFFSIDSLTALPSQRTPDTPTNTFPCFQTENIGNSTVRGWNTQYSGGGAVGWSQKLLSVPMPKTGKWYFEGWVPTNTNPDAQGWVTAGASDYMMLGVTPQNVGPLTSSHYMGDSAGDMAIYKNAASNTSLLDGTTVASVSNVPDISESDHFVAMAYDADNKKIFLGFDDDGTGVKWLANDGGLDGNPVTGDNPSFTFDDSYTNYYAGASAYYNSNDAYPTQMNCGDANNTLNSDVTYQSAANGWFRGTVPTGYKALTAQAVSENIANYQYGGNDPDQPDDFFNTVQYTGTGANQSISTIGFQPDLVWIKDRTDTIRYNWQVYDSLRGDNSGLLLNTAANATDYSAFGGFTSNGFDLQSAVGVNKNTNIHSAYCWKAGGAPTATNTATVGNPPTAGSFKVDGADRTTNLLSATIIPEKQSVNTKGGFSVTTYTGNGTAGATIEHGLPTAPSFIIVKQYDDQGTTSTTNWIVYHRNAGTGYHVLNATVPFNTPGAAAWNSTHPSDTLVTFGGGGTNANGNQFVMYAWCDIEGYTFTGQYHSKGTDNFHVVTSNKPAAVLILLNNATGNKGLIDDVSRPVNGESSGAAIYPSLPNQEQTNPLTDFNGMGFTLQSTGGAEFNADTNIYDFVSWGRQFGQYSNGRG